MKKFLSLLLGLVLALSLVACGASEDPEEVPAAEEPAAEEVAPEPTEKTLPAIAEALGLSDQSEVYFEMIGARDGAEFNGGSVEIYIFDEDQAEYETMINGDGFTVPAAYHDGVVLVFPEGTEPDQALVDAFNGLVF